MLYVKPPAALQYSVMKIQMIQMYSCYRCIDAMSLTQAIGHTSETYRDIGKMHAEQVRHNLWVGTN